MSESTTSVIVVDDHPLFRRGVVDVLNESDNFEVIAQYDSAQQLLDKIDSLAPQLLLLDLQMPETSGLDVLKLLRKDRSDLKIIILTACSDQNMILDALKFGANGYLQKDTPADQIISYLKSTIDGQIALNPSAVTMLASHVREEQVEQSQQPNQLLASMTERERETLFLIADGLNNKLIARELGISDGTVKVYVKSLLRKLDLHSRLELAAWAHQNLADELEAKSE